MNHNNINSIIEAVKDPANFFDTIIEFIVERNTEGEILFFPSNIAVTFKVEIDQKKYALKCYIEHKDSRQEHFIKLKEFFNTHSKEYFVDYTFLANELTLYNGNEAYKTDVLLLPWIDGKTLQNEIFSATHFGDISRISYLRNIFIDLVKDFNSIGFAHGDLKPQNIIFDSKTNSLKVIDYDASWIESISNLTNTEIGTYWYQHPDRHRQSYGSRTDNYSIVLIVVSLIAIEQNLQLFERYNNAENIILSPEEIISGKSAPFRELIKIYSREHIMLGALQSLTKPCPYSASIWSFLKIMSEYNTVRKITSTDVVIDSDGEFRRFYNEDKLYGFIDKNNYIKLEPQWENAEFFENGFAVVRGGSKSYFIDKNCSISSIGFDYISSYDHNQASVCSNGLYGILGLQDFKYIIKPRFLSSSLLYDGIAVVSDNTGFYYVNKDSKKISSNIYDYCTGFDNGHAVVKISSKYSLIDKSEQIICNIEADEVMYIRHGVICILRNNVVIKEKTEDLIK